jgi:hypothetical protein
MLFLEVPVLEILQAYLHLKEIMVEQETAHYPGL